MSPPHLQRLLILALGILISPSHLAAAGEDADSTLDQQLHERVLSIPGDPARPVILQVTLFMPDGPGPFPLVVLNHGKDLVDPRSERRYRSVYAARYFVSRGFAAVLPMLRGFAGSGGVFDPMGCDAEADGLNQAKDIAGVIDFIAEHPDIDPRIDTSRIMVSGQSYGGWNTLAFGTLNHPSIKGLANFAGGRRTNCRGWELALAEAAGHYGQQTRTPSIWIYGDNDKLFSVGTWRGMFERYTRAGGQVDLLAYGQFMKNSHNFLGSVEALPIWTPRMDAFLSKIGLPNTNLHPELLPQPYPEPSNFAELSNVYAVPFLNGQGRQRYAAFLTEEMPRVFVIAVDGTSVSSHGGYDPLARALELCRMNGRTCRPYAVDEEVVWPKPMAPPPATGFAALDDVAAVPYINDNGRRGYERFLTLPNPRSFVIAPDGGWAFSSRDFDSLTSALETCRKKHQECAFYAVDDQVVWPGR